MMINFIVYVKPEKQTNKKNQNDTTETDNYKYLSLFKKYI